jgi:hypothetical protein
MLLTLHDRLGIEKSSTWEDVAEQFDMIDDVTVHEPGMLENGSSEQNLELNDLERMLALERVCVVEMSLEEMTAVLSGVRRTSCLNCKCDEFTFSGLCGVVYCTRLHPKK